MDTILSVLQVLIAIAMIAIVLVQRGPGAAAGSGFGAGSSGTVFGARGSGSFLTRTTAILAAGFFGISMVMGVMASRTVGVDAEPDLGVMAGVVEQAEQNSGEVPTFEAVEPEVGSEVPQIEVPDPLEDGDMVDASDEAAGDQEPVDEQ